MREERNKNSEERSGRGRTSEQLGSISKQQLRTPCRIFFDMPEKRVISCYLIIIFIYKYILLINKQVNELGVLIMTDFGLGLKGAGVRPKCKSG